MTRIIGIILRLAGAAGIGAGLLSATGCALGGELSPSAAFAMSASALSGRDQFTFNGQLSAYDPNGRLADQSSFRGEVSGHKPSALVWEGTAASASAPAHWNHPLTLVSFVESGSSEVSYAGSNSDEVVLEMKLDPDTARGRIQEELKNQMRAVAEETNALLTDRQDKSTPLAKRKLEQSSKRLDEALSGLRVTTVCRWTADRRTWFPKKLREESVLTYSLSGKSYTEKRISETNFETKGGQ